MAEPQLQNSAHVHLRKKRKKSRYLKQGYHKSERDDCRRVAARAFLSGITRDSHLQVQQNLVQDPASEEDENATSFVTIPSSRKHSIIPLENVDSNVPSPPSTPVLDAHYSPTFKRTAEGYFEPSQQHIMTRQMTLGNSRSLDQVVESHSHHHLSGVRTSHSVDNTESASSYEHKSSLVHTSTKWSSSAEGMIYENQLPPLQYYATGRSSRIVCTTHTHTVASVYSILPYNKTRHDKPRERMRARGNSFSVQMDLEGVELGTTTNEVSLAFLLDSIWIPADTSQPSSELDTPSLSRRASLRKPADVTVTDKRTTTPTSLARHHLNTDMSAVDLQIQSFPGQVFRDNQSPLHVILSYHPQYLNNEELFASSKTTTLTPPGYRVSIIGYARKSDIKKGLNDRFKELYPHVEVSLTKLRKVKMKMHEVATECRLDLVAVSYAYVYFEKLVLMGKVHKSFRKSVAGVCLLLAAKFILDLKKQEISDLINEITDNFHISSRELLLYEFPVLASLQFSLLTPNFQARPHYDRLVRGDHLHHHIIS